MKAHEKSAMHVAPLLLSLVAVLGSVAYAGPVEDLASQIDGRMGTASEDRRRSVKVFPGVQVDCPGDTLDATVRITRVSGKLEGDVASMVVTYEGEYTRQGWGAGCNRLPGREHGRIKGSIAFNVTGRAFTRPTISWGAGSDFGGISDKAGHDSNIFGVRAAQNAVSSAL